MTDKKMWKKLRDQLRDQGCTFEVQDNTHVRVYRGGELVTIMQQSKANPRSWLNKRAELRRKGLQVP